MYDYNQIAMFCAVHKVKFIERLKMYWALITDKDEVIYDIMVEVQKRDFTY